MESFPQGLCIAALPGPVLFVFLEIHTGFSCDFAKTALSILSMHISCGSCSSLNRGHDPAALKLL